MKTIKKYIKYKQTDNEFKNMVQQIADLCAIPSISVTNLENEYPFGKPVNDALDYTLRLCNEYGFTTYKDLKNRYGYAQIGNGKKIIGILCHLDVVPSGDESQWEAAAFEPLIKEDEIFGRGTLDDKGPTIITLHALKYILENNLIDDNHTIRVVFGLSEETTMESMKFYFEDFGYPDLAYTPDGEWPLIFAEKMIFDYNLLFNKIEDFDIYAGEVYNQVPDSLVIKSIKNKEISLKMNKNDYELLADRTLIIKGVAAHGSTPESGDNAIIKFTNALLNLEYDKYIQYDLIRFIYNNFQNYDFTMPLIFKNYEDLSGKLSSNPAIIRTKKQKHVLGFDMRVPVLKDKETVKNDLLNYLKENNYKCEFELEGSKVAKYIEKNHPLVQILLNTYREAINDPTAEAIAIGGGTYARCFQDCVAFGATTKMDLMHAPNERFTFEEIKLDLEIYINALYRLQDI